MCRRVQFEYLNIDWKTVMNPSYKHIELIRRGHISGFVLFNMNSRSSLTETVLVNCSVFPTCQLWWFVQEWKGLSVSKYTLFE